MVRAQGLAGVVKVRASSRSNSNQNVQSSGDTGGAGSGGSVQQGQGAGVQHWLLMAMPNGAMGPNFWCRLVAQETRYEFNPWAYI